MSKIIRSLKLSNGIQLHLSAEFNALDKSMWFWRCTDSGEVVEGLNSHTLIGLLHNYKLYRSTLQRLGVAK